MQSARNASVTINFIALAFLMCFCLQPLAASEFKIITLQHRLAEDILPSIKPVVSGNGTVSGIQNQLIIRTTPENMQEIERVIAALDTARQNLKITVRKQNNANISGNTAHIGIRKRIGNIEIISNDALGSRDSAHVHIEDHQSSIQSSSDQSLTVAEGERAFISVGQATPFTQEWLTLTHRYASIHKTTEFIEISTGFSVRPRNMGSQIHLEITPRISSLNHDGVIDFDVLGTTVMLKRGEWLNLGGLMQQKDEVSRAILIGKNYQRAQNNQFLIRID